MLWRGWIAAWWVGCFWFCGVVRDAQAEEIVIEKIVALVNNEIILLSEWEQRFGLAKEKLQQIIDPKERENKAKELRAALLQQMIYDKLIDQQAKKEEITVEESDIDQAIKRTREQNQSISEKDFFDELRKRGFTPEAYKGMMRREIRKFRLLQKTMASKIRISEEDLRAFYKNMTRKEKPGPPEFKVRHILFSLEEKPTPEELKLKKQQAENVLILAKQTPKSFAALAKRFSQDTGSSESGGDLGYLKSSDIDPALGKAIMTLRDGQVYDGIVRTSLGFHVLFLETKRASNILSYEEAKPSIQRRLQEEAYEKAYERYVKELMQKAVVEIRVKDQLVEEKKVFKSTFGPVTPTSPEEKKKQEDPKRSRGGGAGRTPRGGGFPR